MYRFTLKWKKKAPISTCGGWTAAAEVNVLFASIHSISGDGPDLSLSSAGKVTSPLCVLPVRQCHSTMYKHEKAHQGNWGFNNQRLGARRDQWFQMEVQGQREGGRRREGAITALSPFSANEPRVLWECFSAGLILFVLRHPFHTKVTCWSSDRCATLQPVP